MFDKVLNEYPSELASKVKDVLFLNQFEYQRYKIIYYYKHGQNICEKL